MRSAALDVLRCPRSGQRLSIQVQEHDGDDVETALLRSESGSWPVLGGIAVLTEDGEAVVPLVQQGRTLEAAAEVAFGDRPRDRPSTLAHRLRDHGPKRLARTAGRWLERKRTADTELLADPDPRRVLERLLLGAYPPMPDAHAYFRYRFSLPRHLVALQVLQLLGREAGPVLDLGCGAGHMAFSLSCLRPQVPVVGVDLSFAQLWVARRLIAPQADYVCADVRRLPFADRAFADAVSVDVLSFVRDKWPAAREARRVVRPDGLLAVTSVKDADRSHVYAGLPLTAAGWARLFDGAPVRVLDDDVLLDTYLRGLGIPDTDQPTRSAAVSLLVGSDRSVATPDPLAHAVGPLAVNPLYRAVTVSDDEVQLQLAPPGGSYVPDNARMLEYLPSTAVLPTWLAEAGARGERPDELLELARAFVVLALPPGYVSDPWPGAGSARGRAVAW